MTKSTKHKREVRKEKTKIKLKISQKDGKRKKKGGLLPKGLNVTDTSFKTRKIVIQENLRAVSDQVPTTVRKQTFKELVGHLNHFSTSVRQDGIRGLKELLPKYPEVLQSNLSSIFDKVTQQVLDRDADLRQASVKLLETVLKMVDENQVSPFFPLLIAQLTCAMTHILPAIQQTSLEFLDALLANVPKLMSTVAFQVLPNFLEQISRQDAGKSDSKKRVLTADPSRKLTTLKWRQQVLQRTSRLLELVIDNSGQSTETNMTEMVHDGERCYAPLYANSVPRLALTIPAPGFTTKSSSERSIAQNFISTLVPLVVETWIEAMASEQLAREKGESLVSAQTADLLSSVVSVLLLSLQLLHQESGDRQEMLDWFKKNYADDLERHFLQRFPYSSQAAPRQAKGKEKKAIDQECRSQNIDLCYLWAELQLDHTKSLTGTITAFLTNLFTSAQSSPLTSVEADRLLFVLAALLKTPTPAPGTNKVAQSLVDFIQNVRPSRKDRLHLSRALVTLTLELETSVLERIKPLQKWLQECPKLLRDADTITVKSVNKMLSRNSSPAVRKLALEETVKLFKGDLKKNSAYLKELLNLLYWTCRGDDSLEKREIVAIATNSAALWPPEVADYAKGVEQLL